MTERYFNREQEAHMRELGKIPRDQRCASGWHRIGECWGEPCKPHNLCSICGAGSRWCRCFDTAAPAAAPGGRDDEWDSHGRKLTESEHEIDTLRARLAASEARVRELEGLLRDFLDQCINDDCSLCERGDAALRGAEGD